MSDEAFKWSDTAIYQEFNLCSSLLHSCAHQLLARAINQGKISSDVDLESMLPAAFGAGGLASPVAATFSPLPDVFESREFKAQVLSDKKKAKLLMKRQVKAELRFFSPTSRSAMTAQMSEAHIKSHTGNVSRLAPPLDMSIPHRKAIMAASAAAKLLAEQESPANLRTVQDIKKHSGWKSYFSANPRYPEPQYNWVNWSFSGDIIRLHYTPMPGHLNGAFILKLGRYKDIYLTLAAITGESQQKEQALANVLIKHSCTGIAVRDLIAEFGLEMNEEQVQSLTRIAALVTIHEVSRRKYPGQRTNGSEVQPLPFGVAQAASLALLSQGATQAKEVFDQDASLAPVTGAGITTQRNISNTIRHFQTLSEAYRAFITVTHEEAVSVAAATPAATVMPTTEHYHKLLQSVYGITSDSEGEEYSDTDLSDSEDDDIMLCP